jgi:D-inositol-3-phosphate glycosyltransferase
MSPPLRAAVLSMHTDPLGRLGGEVSGGMNVYVRETSRALPALGARVDIFTRAEGADEPAAEDLAPGARLIRIPAGPREPVDKNLQAQYAGDFASGIRNFAASGGGYDLISSHYWLSALAGRALVREWGVPLIHRFHTLAAHKNRALPGSEGLESEERVRGEMDIARGADALIASSLSEAGILTKALGAEESRVHVVPCGVDAERFRPLPRGEARAALGLEEGERVLLSVGRIEPVKGLDRLVQALAGVREKRPDLRISVIHVGGEVREGAIGGGTAIGDARPEDFISPLQRREVERILGLAEAVGVAQFFRFTGARSQEELRVFYSAADAMAIPSRYETFSLVALEAAACALPAVAFGVGGIAGAIAHGESGLIVPDGDAAAFAEAALDLIASPGLGAKLGEGARKRAELLSWGSAAGKELSVWRGLLEARRGSLIESAPA